MNRNKWIVNLVLGFVKVTGFIPALIFLKPRIHRVNQKQKHLPKPCILVSNHKSLLDFVLYLIIFPFRTIRFLMAEVLYNKGKFFGGFLSCLGGIRVDRDDKNFSFVSDSLEVIEKGGSVGIFPEGRLPIGGKPWPFTVSTAFIASRCDALIVPIYTDGNYGIFKRANVVIGEPFSLNDYITDEADEDARLKKLTEILEKKVYELRDKIKKDDENAPKQP